ncbi:hypothetical protein TWF694_000076 [Orbilia ellipsospora]|uniref:Brl1/Brr6 domain-containing protein n=1 Tax=Orbilia ellipsospora TaxID=2528407 RepID=A0AAV9XMJ7_9PEZI
MAASRSNESPMDWQWDKEGGPADPSSPFAMHNQRYFQRSFENGPPRKRHFGEVAITPIKDRPNLAAPTSKPLFFTPHQSSLDSTNWKTPRDFQSPSVASEAEDSPAPNVAGLDTTMLSPDDTPTKAPLKTAAATDAKPEKKDQKTGIFGSFGFSPAKKSSREPFKPPKFSDNAAKKVAKRRQRNGSGHGDFWTHSGDFDDDDNPFGPSAKLQQTVPGRTWAETHRDIPQVLSQYLQLIVNILIAALGMYVVYLVVKTIQRDVEKKQQEYIAEAQLHIGQCQSQWVANRCNPETRVPAMEDNCLKWRICADSDPYAIGRSKVSAETFAEIINGFVEPISYKSMAFCFVLVFGCIFVSNFAFGFFRAKVGGHPAPVLAAAAPRFVEYGGAAGVVHPYTTTIFATPARLKSRGRSRSPTKAGRTPFFTAKKATKREEEEEDEDEAYEEEMSPTVARKRIGW